MVVLTERMALWWQRMEMRIWMREMVRGGGKGSRRSMGA